MYLLTIFLMKSNELSVVALNHLISAYTVTAQNARFCHWNVVGPHFEDDHEFFGELYDELSNEVDLFAERIRSLVEYPISSLALMLTETSLREYNLPMTARNMQKNMLADYNHISSEMSQMAISTANDVVTQDIIVGSKRQIDKRAWMLRSMLGE